MASEVFEPLELRRVESRRESRLKLQVSAGNNGKFNTSVLDDQVACDPGDKGRGNGWLDQQKMAGSAIGDLFGIRKLWTIFRKLLMTLQLGNKKVTLNHLVYKYLSIKKRLS